MTTIVVPCYNEAARFPLALVENFLAAHPEIRFVFVNDGSRDATAAMLRGIEQRFPGQATAIDRSINKGKGESVREGLLKALERPDAGIVGFWDADLATPLEAIHELREIFEQRPQTEMVFGARVSLLGRAIRRKPIRHYLGRIFATTVSVMLKLPVYDTQCGAKLFRDTPRFRKALDGPFITRWVFDVELIARWIRQTPAGAMEARSAIFEYPLHSWEDVAGSKVKPYDFIKAFRDVARIYFRYLR